MLPFGSLKTHHINEATLMPYQDARTNKDLLYSVVGSQHLGTASISQPQKHIEAEPAKSSTSQNSINVAVQVVNDKILWASQALSASHSMGECQQLCELLKSCAETLRALKEIQQ